MAAQAESAALNAELEELSAQCAEMLKVLLNATVRFLITLY